VVGTPSVAVEVGRIEVGTVVVVAADGNEVVVADVGIVVECIAVGEVVIVVGLVVVG
jgi:hypothetical protein